MLIKNKSFFWQGNNKYGRYKIPSNYIELDKILEEYQEVKDYLKENKKVKQVYVSFENEDEKNIYLEKKAKIERAIARKEKLLEKERIKNAILSLPLKAQEIVKKWRIISMSPYSTSFYNKNGITWGKKPNGSLRLSNHWNFYSQGEIHCKLNTTNNYLSNTWILAEYNNGIYKEIQRF